MSAKNKCWSRRDFIKTAGITGAGSLLVPAIQLAEADDKTPQVPTRPDVDETGHEMGRNLLGYGRLLSKRQ